jgi:hypothetical protein
MKTALALCLLVASAHADPAPTAELTAHNDPKSPSIDAALIDAPKASRITLTSGTVSMNATKQRPYSQGSDPILIAFVIQSDEAFATANLATIEKALDATGLAKACPPDSFGTIIAYAQDTQTKVAMGPLDRIKGRELGIAKDYKGKKGTSLATAVTLAFSELGKLEAPRKVVIIIGDGSDSDPKAPFADLKKDAARQKIQLFAVVTKTGAVSKLVAPIVVTSPADLGLQINAIAKELVNRFYVTFPVGKLIPFDGKEHEFVVGLDKVNLDPIPLTLR